VLDLSPEKLFVLGVVALVVLGPNRLPAAARSLGRIIGQLRAMSASFQSEVREALHEPGDAISQAVAEFRPGQVRRSVRQAVTNTLAPPSATPAPRPAPDAFLSPTAGTANPDDPSLN
jgi:sec-independent protein translocase protein TatB